MWCGEELEGVSDSIKVLVLEAETERLNQVHAASSQQSNTL